jgi:hypothetical protein
MSFRQFGGLQFASKHNAVASNYNTSNNLLVTQNVGQPNSYINFLSDISGNISVYGDFDLSGNLHVSGDIDCSGNLNVDGDVDVSGNLTADYMFLSSGTNYTTANNGVVPKSYVDSVANGLTPLPFCVLCSNAGPITLSGYQTIDGIALNNTFDGSAILVNAQGGVDVPDVDNGVYIISSGAWSRSSYLNTGANATGTATFILEGTTYSNYRFVCTTTSPAVIGTNPVLWNPFDIPFSLGQGLIKTITTNNNTIISVDSSLNFINYLDNTAGPNPGILNIGTNTNTIKIGKPTDINNKIYVNQNSVGINNNSPNSAYTLDVSGNMKTNADAVINNVNAGRGTGTNNSLNTVFGTNSLQANTTGSVNSAFGNTALRFNTTGSYNNAFGYESLVNNTTGTSNNAFGEAALYSVISGQNNSAFGHQAGLNLTNGSFNTFLGTSTNIDVSTNTYNNSTALGYNAIINASNQIVLGGQPSGGSYPSIKIPGIYVGIGGVYNPASGYALDVSGNLHVSGTIINTATQPGSSDSSTKVPTTAWVQSAITASGSSNTLADVLVSGNSAGSTAINMNNQNISAVGTLSFATTSQTSAYTGGPSGSYTNTNMTIDANGKISAISSGSGGTSNGFPYAKYSIRNTTQSTIQTLWLNTSGGINGPWAQNSCFTIRLSASFAWNFTGSGSGNALNNSTTTGYYDIYPYRFSPNWCQRTNAIRYGNLSTNAINGDSSFGVVDTSEPNGSGDTICPQGRQFWGYDLVNAGSTPGTCQISVSGSQGSMYITLVNPNGWSGNAAWNAEVNLELVNVGANSSTISTSGFQLATF